MHLDIILNRLLVQYRQKYYKMKMTQFVVPLNKEYISEVWRFTDPMTLQELVKAFSRPAIHTIRISLLVIRFIQLHKSYKLQRHQEIIQS